MTDLLPLGYEFDSLSQTFLGYGTGNWYWAPGTGYGTGSSNSTGYPALNIDVRSHLSVEAIDDYSGTGRQLVRVSFDEPPTADGWRGVAPGSSSRVSFKVTPNPMTLAATNQAQVFVSDSVSSSLLQCQTGVFGSPTAASSSDPNDLDADGLTSGDAFVRASPRLCRPLLS